MIFPKHGLIRWISDNKRGLQAVFGGFLIQLCAGVNYIIIYISVSVYMYKVKFLTCLYKGCYHGTFGNLLPYFTSYMRQVNANIIRNDKAYINIVK